MSFDVGSIVGQLQLRKDQWNQAIRDVKADQRSLSGLVLRNSKDFKKMGRAMTVAGAAIVGAMGLMVKAFADFDQAMTESLAIMGDISTEMREDMAGVAKTISEETTYSAKELAEAYFFLASAGMDASQSMTVLGDVARFAQAGAFDLATATDLLTDAQTALGLSSEDAVESQKNLIRVSDVLVGANTLANASVKQFAESLTNKAAAALVNVNKEVEEGIAVLAAYADKGVKGQLAGQRLTMMLNGLFDATRRNKKAWDEAGISLFNADESMRDIADIIQDMEGYLGAMTVKQREAALAVLGFNLKTKDSILTLMGSSEKIRKWTEDLKNMGGITREVSDKQLEAFNNQLKLLRNTVTNAAMSIGKSLAPQIKELIGDIKNVAAKVSEWTEEHPELTKSIAALTLSVGGLLTVLGPLAMMLPGIATGLVLVKKAFIALAAPTGAVSLTVAALVGYVVALGIGIKTVIDETDRWEKESVNYIHTSKLQSAALEEMGVNLEETRKAAGYSRKEFEKLRKEYDYDDVALVRAIMKTDKYITLQRALIETSKKRTEVKREETKAVEDASTAQKTENELMAEALALYEKWKELTPAEEFLAGLKKFKLPKLAASPQELLEDMGIAEGGSQFELMWATSMHNVEEASDQWLTNQLEAQGIYGEQSKELFKDKADSEISMFGKIGAASMMALGQSKEGAIAQAIMSTYAGAAKTIEMLGMPWAIPFIALAIASGFKQVAAIQKTGIPSAEKGAYLPHPAIIEAGHGALGEVVLPLDKAPQIFEGMNRETILERSPIRVIIQNRIVIGEQTFYRESVKTVNKAGIAGDLVIPNKVVV